MRSISVLDKAVDVVLSPVLAGGHLEHVGHAEQGLPRITVGNHLQEREKNSSEKCGKQNTYCGAVVPRKGQLTKFINLWTYVYIFFLTSVFFLTRLNNLNFCYIFNITVLINQIFDVEIFRFVAIATPAPVL